MNNYTFFYTFFFAMLFIISENPFVAVFVIVLILR